MNKVIYLATTKGCEACKIMENILKQVQRNNVYTFSINVRDYTLLPEFIKINVPLIDFPTLIFIEDNVIKYHTVGTMNANRLQGIIKDIHFE